MYLIIRRTANFSLVMDKKTLKRQFSEKTLQLIRILKYNKLILITNLNLKNQRCVFISNQNIKWKRTIFIRSSMFYIKMKMRRMSQMMKLMLRMIISTINLIKMAIIWEAHKLLAKSKSILLRKRKKKLHQQHRIHQLSWTIQAVMKINL